MTTRGKLTERSYAYESGLYGPVLPLLQVAEKYCMSHENCELIMVDVYWTKGSVFTDTNQFQACYESFQTEFAWLQKAIEKGLVQLLNIRQVFAWGGLGNGLQSLNQYEKAEECYRKAFLAWENVPGDRKIYVRILQAGSRFMLKPLRRATCVCVYGIWVNWMKRSNCY